MNYIVQDVEDLLIKKDYRYFVNGVNCQGKFRSGIAGLIRKHEPLAVYAYEHYAGNLGFGKHLLGQISIADLDPGERTIFHMFTQDRYGYDGAKYVSYDAIDLGFQDLRRMIPINENAPILFPLIGAGLGGGNWNVISEIIDDRLDGLPYACVVRLGDIAKYELKNV